MRTIRLLIAIAVALISFSSCSSYKEITIEKVSNLNVRELNGSTAVVDLTLQINNPTGSKIKLKEVNLDVNRKESKFAHVSLQDMVEVPSRSNQEHVVTLEIRVVNILSSGFMLLSKRINPSDFSANGYVKVSSFPFSKKVKFKDENIGSLIKSLEGAMSSNRKNNQ